MTWSSLASPACTFKTSLSWSTRGLTNNSAVAFESIDFRLYALKTFEAVSVIVTVSVHAEPASLQANKLFIIKDITIDDQVIDVYGIKQFPDLTQYIANLGKEELNKKLTKPSSRFGWYGEYCIDVFIGDQQDYVKAYNHPSKILGIIGNKVITNPDHVKITRTKKWLTGMIHLLN